MLDESSLTPQRHATEDIMASHLLQMRPTRADIDLRAIRANLQAIREHCGRKVLAVVKADAYGHGLVQVARSLERAGVDHFGVALAEEGIALREAGIDAPILILNGAYGNAHREVIQAGLTPVIHHIGQLQDFAACGNIASVRRIPIHMKVDTGMNRLGISILKLESTLRELERHPQLRLEGLMTHFATADGDRNFLRVQKERFDGVIDMVRGAGFRPSLIHAANAAATFGAPQTHYDMVRPGLALFGYGHDSLQPALRWTSRVLATRTLCPGEGVGYDQTFVAERETKIAVLPVGYADGLRRAASEKGQILLRGRRCPFVGRISMDLCAVEVAADFSVSIGDEAVIIGAQGDDFIGADEHAAFSNTITWEILTTISKRVPRHYVDHYGVTHENSMI